MDQNKQKGTADTLGNIFNKPDNIFQVQIDANPSKDQLFGIPNELHCLRTIFEKHSQRFLTDAQSWRAGPKQALGSYEWPREFFQGVYG